MLMLEHVTVRDIKYKQKIKRKFNKTFRPAIRIP